MKSLFFLCVLIIAQSAQSQGYETSCRPDGFGGFICESLQRGGAIFDSNSIFRGAPQQPTPTLDLSLPDSVFDATPPTQRSENLHQICQRSGFRSFNHRTQRCN